MSDDSFFDEVSNNVTFKTIQLVDKTKIPNLAPFSLVPGITELFNPVQKNSSIQLINTQWLNPSMKINTLQLYLILKEFQNLLNNKCEQKSITHLNVKFEQVTNQIGSMTQKQFIQYLIFTIHQQQVAVTKIYDLIPILTRQVLKEENQFDCIQLMISLSNFIDHKSIITILDDILALFTHQSLREYAEIIHIICCINSCKQLQIDQTTQFLQKLLQKLAHYLNYFQQLAELHLQEAINNGIFIFPTIFTAKSTFTEFDAQAAFKPFHVKTACLIEATTSIYLISRGKSPLNAAMSQEYNELADFQNVRFVTGILSTTSFSQFSQLSQKMVQSAPQKDIEFSELDSNEKTIQLEINKIEIDEEFVEQQIEIGINIKKYCNELTKSKEKIFLLMCQLRSITAVFNFSKVKLDSTMAIANATFQQMQSETYESFEDPVMITPILDPIQNISHIILSTIEQCNNFYLNYYANTFLFTNSLISSFKTLQQYDQFSNIKIAICELSISNLKQMNVNNNLLPIILHLMNDQAKILIKTQEWYLGIILELETLKILQKVYPHDKQSIIDLCLEISQNLFYHNEYDYAQDFMCYILELLQQVKVIHDERVNRYILSKSNNEDEIRMKFYETIQSINLMECVKQIEDVEKFSETSDVSSHNIETISRQVYEIYMKRVQFYKVQGNLKASIHILKQLLKIQISDSVKTEILMELCQIFVQQTPVMCQTQFDCFQSLDEQLSQIYNNKIETDVPTLIRGYSIIIQFYSRIGHLVEALILCFCLQHWQEFDNNKKLVKLQIKILSQFLGCQTSNCINQVNIQIESQLPQLGLCLMQQISTNNSELNLPNNLIKLLWVEETKISLNTSKQNIINLFISLTLDILQKLDKNSQFSLIIELWIDLLMCLNMYQQRQFYKAQIYFPIVSQNGKISVFLIKNEEEQIDFTFISLNLIQILPLIQNSIQKIQVQLLLANILLDLRVNVEDFQNLFTNSVNFVYSTMMCGPHTLPAIFDANYLQLLQIQQIYELIINICMKLSPRPLFTLLFIDASIILESHIKNSYSHKYYPYALQEKETRYKRDKNYSLNFNCSLQLHTQKVIGTFFNQNNQIQREQVNIFELIKNKTEKLKILEQFNKLPSVLDQKWNRQNYQFDKNTLWLYQDLINKKIDHLHLYNKILQVNTKQIFQKFEKFDHQNINFNTMYKCGTFFVKFCAQTNVNDDINLLILQQNEKQVQQMQQQVFNLINTADLVRLCLSNYNNYSFQDSLFDFCKIYAQQDLPNIYFQLWSQIYNYQQINAETISKYTIQLFNLNYNTTIIESICVQNLLSTQYLNQILFSHSRDDKQLKFDQLTLQQSIQMFNDLRSKLKINSVNNDIAQQLFGQEYQIFKQIPLHLYELEYDDNLSKQFQFILMKMNQGYQLQIDMIKQLKYDKPLKLVTSLDISIIPFEQLYNQAIIRNLSIFNCIVQQNSHNTYTNDLKQLKIDVSNLQSIQSSNQIIKMQDINQFCDQLIVLSSNNKQNNQLTNLFHYYKPKVQVISNFLDAPGRKSSQFEQNRRTQTFNLYCINFGHCMILQHRNSISNIDEQIFNTYEGILLPFQSQLLKYGQKEMLTQKIDVIEGPDYTLDSTVGIVQCINIYPNINNIKNEYDQLIKLSNQKMQQFNALKHLQNFQQIQFPNPQTLFLNQFVRNIGKCKEFGIYKHKILVVQIIDILHITDQVMMLMLQNHSIIGVPGAIVSQTCNLITWINTNFEHLLQESLLFQEICQDINTLLSVIQTVIRRTTGQTVMVWK